nr:RagB/SusD family nutrient uptake outer membrane protein [Segatella maculosa]
MSYDGKERVFGYYTWQARSGQNETYTGYNTENQSWQDYYNRINVANNIIAEAAVLKEAGEEGRRGRLKVDGEARFLRAYYYFMLVNMYGKPYSATATTDLGVPLKTTEVVEDRRFGRNTVQECYDLILTDLQTAETELAEYGAQRSKYRADATAVRLLLSRVYLYMQYWDKAAEYARKVIELVRAWSISSD